MKKSTAYILLTVFSLLVLIGLQTYSLLRIFNLETDRFENLYKETIRNGLNALEGAIADFGLSNAYYALDANASLNLDYYRSGKLGEKDTLPFRKILLKNTHNTFNENQNLSTLVKKILEKNSINTKFKTYFVFHKYQLESENDTLNVYDSKADFWKYPDTLNISSAAVSMGRYNYWGNNFSCQYEFLIDFSEMKRVVLGEITGVLLVMILSLLIVGIIFIVTVRNMLEERRLSLLKTDFINNMTHELKTPLSTIAIATKSLEQESFYKDEEKVKSTARVIGRQNKLLSKQINHLLEVSMWERMQFDLDKKYVPLHAFLIDLIEAFRWEHKDSPIRVETNCDIPPDLELFMDETQMATALHNLLVNGVKYNDKDPLIQLDCAAGEGVVIRIRDNGIGISKENQKHIFEKFYRVHTGNIHKVKGLGLGLFYVKQIVEAHEGTVSLKSKLGKGTEFIVKLPNNGRSKNSTR